IGDLGPWAYRFVDFLSESNQSFWQILPLNPTNLTFGSSPYSSPSAFAGNPLIISPESLVEDSLLANSDIEDSHLFSDQRVDYAAVTNYKEALFQKAHNSFKKKGESTAFEEFCNKNSYWLEDYALFTVLKAHYNGGVWSEWTKEIVDRNEKKLQELKNNLRDKVELEKFIQYIFFKQWFSLKSYSNSKRINIIGDIPIYVNHDSADVWANPEIFKLDKKKWPMFVAGVPPDYFSKTGQRWGNPVYKWNILREKGYQWWINRMEHNLKLFDMMRLDHFRGFVGYWEVPADEKTAINGKWRKAPAKDFFMTLVKRFNHLPIIAEDLGVITPNVLKIMKRFGFPGMKLLLFAFGDDFPTGSYLPHNYTKDCVVYTGTHDNNTVKGWWKCEASPEDRKRFFKYIGKEVSEESIHWEFIRLATMSVANICIIPIQDVLGLDEDAKMNRPAKAEGNWQWRLKPDQITSSLIDKLKEITETYGRGY
ncbi:MAG: 4-alpha-glucanotransferase, partial [Thermodesulfobacteriota bacterium]